MPVTNRLITSDNIGLESFSTDANIDESCNHIDYGSNWLAYVGKSISTIYNTLLMMTNTGITP